MTRLDSPCSHPSTPDEISGTVWYSTVKRGKSAPRARHSGIQLGGGLPWLACSEIGLVRGDIVTIRFYVTFGDSVRGDHGMDGL